MLALLWCIYLRQPKYKKNSTYLKKHEAEGQDYQMYPTKLVNRIYVT